MLCETGDCHDPHGVEGMCVAGAIQNFTLQLLHYREGTADRRCKESNSKIFVFVVVENSKWLLYFNDFFFFVQITWLRLFCSYPISWETSIRYVLILCCNNWTFQELVFIISVSNYNFFFFLDFFSQCMLGIQVMKEETQSICVGLLTNPTCIM